MNTIQPRILCQVELKKWVSYNPLNGAFVWVMASRKVGRYAGHQIGRGYVKIPIKGKVYMAHRLAWLYVHGVWPDEEIDHINGVRDDNRIINLRMATPQQNKQNTGLRKDNTSGYKGVYYDKKNSIWKAQISINTKQKQLGRFKTAELAYEAYCNKAKEVFGEFARII